MKKIKSMSVDEKVYKKFKKYAISIRKSVSMMLEEYMRQVLEENKNK